MWASAMPTSIPKTCSTAQNRAIRVLHRAAEVLERGPGHRAEHHVEQQAEEELQVEA